MANMITMSRGKITSSVDFEDVKQFLAYITTVFPEAELIRIADDHAIYKSGSMPLNIIIGWKS